MFTCKYCHIHLKTLKSYVDHYRFHKNEAHPSFCCGIIGCMRDFVTYNAFKSHIYRNHTEYSPSPQVKSVLSSFKCENVLCEKQCKDLLAHLRTHMTGGQKVNCPFSGCNRTFKVKSSLSAHISRPHRNWSLEQVSPAWVFNPSHQNPLSVTSENDATDHCVDDSLAVELPDNVTDLYLRNLCIFYMKLQAKYLIPSSTVQMIVEEMNHLNELGQLHVQKHLELTLINDTSLSESDICGVVRKLKKYDLHATCSASLSTTHARQQYFHKHFNYVHPQRVYLGTDDNRKAKYAQYIPLK